MKSHNSDRIRWVDNVKGVSIMLIIISHLVDFDQSFISNCLFAGYVATFYVISGYTLNFHKQHFHQFVLRKAKKLLIPYAIYGFLGILSIWGLNKYYGTEEIGLIYRICGLVYSRYCLYPFGNTDNICWLDGISPMWFLTSLFTSYFLLYLYIKVRNSKVIENIFVVIVICCCLTYLFTLLPILLPWSLDSAFICASFLLFGYYLKKTESLKMNYISFAGLLLAYVFIVYFNGVPNLSISKYGNYGLCSVFLFFFIGVTETYLFAYVCKFTQYCFFSQILSWIGRQSLRLMCIHIPVYIYLCKLSMGGAITCILVSLFLCYMLDYISKFSNKLTILKYI